MSDFDKYYLEQAGSGIAFYPGIRYQKGHGVFGRLFGRVLPALLPVLKSIGRTVLGTGLDVADDVVNGNSDLKTSIKRRGMAAMKDTAQGLISNARSKLAQSGSGKRRRRRRTSKTTKKTMPLFTIKAGAGITKRKRKSRKSKKNPTRATKSRKGKKTKSTRRKRKTKTTTKRTKKGLKGVPRKPRKKAAAGQLSSNLPAYLKY